MQRCEVFLSHSHKDKALFHEFPEHLTPLVDSDLLCTWSDEDIPSAAKREKEIGKAMAQAAVAVLLMSRSLQASSYITI